jgi:hypothetical protein
MARTSLLGFLRSLPVDGDEPTKPPFNVSDYDTASDDNGGLGFPLPKTQIPLIITPGKKDIGNNFVHTVWPWDNHY